jgi:phosphomannomutase
MTDLKTKALGWLAADPDPVTKAAGTALLDNPEALQDHFGSALRFGTAGIRGALGPGPNRMNRVLVRRVASALANYVADNVDDAKERGVVIGFDGRHGSREFAEDTAAVFGAAGFVIYLFDDVAPTPVLAHAITSLNNAVGVMVTASHNPPGDNGYKVYWENGAQIIPPHDVSIADRIDLWGAGPQLADLTLLRQDKRLRDVPESVHTAYRQRVVAQRVHPSSGVRAVYTAMHGVGWRTLEAVLTEAGHTDVYPVMAQRDPDGDFPTVPFPNPEEPGALDMAIALAENVDADVIVANDPDADRLAVAIPSSTGWTQLTGNQVGCLLADDLLQHGPKGLVATTIVSSTLLSRLAAEYDVPYVETLTGFKWIADAAISHPGHFVMGYEEALGYSIGPVVRDKDGISAILLLLDLVGWCKDRGETLWDRLINLYERHSVHSSRQHSLVLTGAAGKQRIADIMASLRDHPPVAIGGIGVSTVRDVLTGVGRDLISGTSVDVNLPPSNVLAWSLADGSRVLARPSGTEPKLKLYFEVITPLDGTLAEAEKAGQGRIDGMLADLLLRLEA